MRLEPISGYQIAWVVCPGCGDLLPIIQARKATGCPRCGHQLRLFVCEYGIALIEGYKNSGQN